MVVCNGRNFDKFVTVMMDYICKAAGIPRELLTERFEHTSAVYFMRHYEQAGPWADMLKEI